MSYTIDPNDEDAIVFSGHKEGIAQSPYEGISDMRNINIVPIPGEASVNFSTTINSYGPAYGTITSVDTGTDEATLTFTSGTIEVGTAIIISGTNLPSGISANTVYWTQNNGSPTRLYSNYKRTVLIDITTTGTPGDWTWKTFNMGIPKYFAFDGTYDWMIDSNSQVWSNQVPTDGPRYWTFTGNKVNGKSHGNGLVYYQASDGNGYLFAFSDSSIDYTSTSVAAGVNWVYQWSIANGTTGSFNSSPTDVLKTIGGINNNHECLVGTDNRVYFTDANWVGSFYQTSPTIAFDPTSIATYTYDTRAIIPFTEIGQCLAQSGTNLLIGGKKNVIYPWDRFSTTNSYPIFIAESNVIKMVTVNTNTYILAGNRGRIYVTNGTQAQLFKKIPDHLSGTVEPYYTWGGLSSNKNQLYFSALVSTNAGAFITTMGGLWAIDLTSDLQAIRMINQLSYETGVGAGTGNYAGYASALIPDFSTLPAGTGLFSGWTSSGSASITGRTVTDARLSSDTSLVSATANFTLADVGSAITGIGIPPLTSILTFTNSTTVVLSQAATTSTGTTSTINIATNGIDKSSSSPYTSSQAYIDYDLTPVGTALRKKTYKTVEYKLSVPMVTNESVSIYWRQNFYDAYTLIFTSSGVTSNGSISDNSPVNFQNVQWIQLRVVLNSTASSPSFTRLEEIRIK